MRLNTFIAGVSMAALATGFTHGVSHAQPGVPSAVEVQEVVVVAQKRKQKLQDVPIAVTALTAKELQDHHVTNVMDLQGMVPALEIKTDDAAANPKIFIRGVGLNDFNPNATGSVGIYADGVYIGAPLAQMGQFFDLEQVEVLRGPQGTLYGRNTTGGAINLITRKPTDAYQADMSLEYGSFNAIKAEVGVGGPLVKDLLSFRVAGLYQKDDGYTLNRLTENTGNDTNNWTTRATLLYTPTDDLDVTAVIKLGQSRGGSILGYNRTLLPLDASVAGADGLCAPAAYTSGLCVNALGYANTSSDLYEGDYHVEGQDVVKTFGASVTARWNLGSTTLTSVTGYDWVARDDVEDTDDAPVQLLDARYVAEQSVYSQELRLQNSDTSAALNWVGGLYFAHDALDSNSAYNFFTDCASAEAANPFCALVDPTNVGTFTWPFRQVTDSYAAFGQLDYHFTPKLSLTFGLRYSSDQKRFTYNSQADIFGLGVVPLAAADEKKTFGSLSGRLGIQYAITDHANIYASFNRGFKSGGFFGGFTTNSNDLAPYRDEKLNAYEIGTKTDWLHRKVRLNLSAFYYDYKDLQVYTIVTEDGLPIQRFTNASNAHISGGEVELAATPIRMLNLTLGVSVLDATYADFVSADEATDYSGNHLPNSPDFSLNAGVSYEHKAPFGGYIRLQANGRYRSKVYFDTTNADRLSDKARTFVDSELGWRDDQDRYEVGIWGRNLTDETNIMDIVPTAALGFDAISVGRPRSYGVYLRMKY
jgi:iron complex outermembrane receptor protein